jgi:hypothetical protein
LLRTIINASSRVLFKQKVFIAPTSFCSSLEQIFIKLGAECGSIENLRGVYRFSAGPTRLFIEKKCEKWVAGSFRRRRATIVFVWSSNEITISNFRPRYENPRPSFWPNIFGNSTNGRDWCKESMIGSPRSGLRLKAQGCFNPGSRVLSKIATTARLRRLKRL